jgi:hypothetical protein
MTPKPLLLICGALLCLTYSSRAQLLKKVKDKVNKTISGGDKNSDKKEDDSASSDNNNSTPASTSPDDNPKSAKWCEGLDANSGSGSSGTTTKDGIEYKKVYSSDNGFTILYDESSLGNNSKDFRLVLSEKVNNKYQFVFIENGNVVAKDSKVHPEWFAKSSQAGIREKKGEVDEAMKKYIVGDTMKQEIAKSDAKTTTVKKIDDDQMNMALEVARQSDDYKKMSDAEKKEFEENAKKALAANNSMAGTTYDVPAQQGGTVALVNGYFVVVKGKKYGKFMQAPVIEVSKDETKFLAVGMNEQAAPMMIVNGKTVLLDKNRFNGMNGNILRSPDQKKFVYLEQKKMTEKEIEELTNSSGSNRRQVIQYNVIKPDGTMIMVTDYSYTGKFRMTNSGSLIYINEETGEAYADDKAIGKFPLKSGDRINAEEVLIGNDISQIAWFDGAEGTFTYIDGTVKKLGMTAPHFSSENGKGYVSWFRKCGKDIYVAKYAY